MVTADCNNSTLLTSLTDFTNGLFQGIVPTNVLPIFFGARLIALSKKDGGIRPIAIGYTLRRLAAKVANGYATEKLVHVLAPLQLGVGSAGGMEAAVHATRYYLSCLPNDHSIVKLDFQNAFNSLRRDAMLDSVSAHLPELFPFINGAYSHSSFLQFHDSILQSCEGIQQGDPLGPLLFSLTIQPLIENCEAELRLAYLDDVTLGGPTSTLISDIDRLKSDAAVLGLKLNVSKSEWIHNSSSPDSDVLKDFIEVNPEDAVLLGSPLSSSSSLTNILTKRVDDLHRSSLRLRLLHSHDALIILRHSLSLPSLLHNLRSAPYMDHVLLKEFDHRLHISLSEILNQDLDDCYWAQASLPVRDGGLGIRSACELAPSAFLASAASTANLVSMILPFQASPLNTQPCVVSALESWKLQSNASPPSGSTSKNQRVWDNLIIKNTQARLLTTLCNNCDQVRLKASFA